MLFCTLVLVQWLLTFAFALYKDFNADRQKQLVQKLRAEGYIKTKRVENVMLKFDHQLHIPKTIKHEFEETYFAPWKEINIPLYMHAFCLETLNSHLKKGSRVLHIGSGCGYLTGCMAELIGNKGRLVAMDNIPRGILYTKYCLMRGHDYLFDKEKWVKLVEEADLKIGYPYYGSFDVIHVSMATPSVPEAYLQQLKNGGRMLIPIGNGTNITEMTVYDKDRNGHITITKIPGRFHVCRMLKTRKLSFV